jgi:uracil-DNA glycosylase
VLTGGACAADDIASLRESIGRCRICRDAPAGGRPLPHEPRPVCIISSSARLLICGQAPGTRVHASGRPFTDPSGDRLRDWTGLSESVFYDARQVAIVPMGFCFPGLDAKGGDLPQRRECRTAWHDRVFAAMPRAELLLVVGRRARDYHLPERRGESMSRTVAEWRTVVAESARSGRTIFPLPHPSWRNSGWLNRNPWFADALLPQLRARVASVVR